MFGKSSIVVSALSLLWLSSLSSRAHADFSFSISTAGLGSNQHLTGGPFANVHVSTVNSNTIHVEINAIGNGQQHFLFRTIGMNLASGVTMANNPSSLAWTVGAGSPTAPMFMNGPIRLVNIFSGSGSPYYNSLVYSGNYGYAGFTQMSFDLTGIEVVGDGRNFFSGNVPSNLMAMQVIAFGDPSFTQWLGNGFAMSGAVTTVNPAPPAVVLLASGVVTSLGGFIIRRRRRKN